MEVVSLSPNRSMILISVSILVYEYVITINQEVERFWATRKLSWASFLFYVNRYLTLFGHIPIIFENFWVAWFPEKASICHQLQLFHEVLAIVIQTVAAGLLILRTYALYDRHRYASALLVFPFVTGIVAICWTLIWKSGNSPPNYIGCDSSLNHTDSIYVTAFWAVLLAFDTLIFGMTAYKILRFHRLTGADLPMLILRDGLVYYLAIMTANLAVILTLLLSGPGDRGSVTPFANVISSVLISRQMLNLRDPELGHATHEI